MWWSTCASRLICPPEAAQTAQALALDLAAHLEVVGLLAVELFYTTDGRFFLNESAPRPHNTGHVTVKACWTSQFEQHWRALLGLPLGDTRVHTPAGLVNLLGPEGQHGRVSFPTLPELLALPGTSVHLYGKRRSSPYRKLGHVLVLVEDPAELPDRIAAVRQRLQIEVQPE